MGSILIIAVYTSSFTNFFRYGIWIQKPNRWPFECLKFCEEFSVKIQKFLLNLEQALIEIFKSVHLTFARVKSALNWIEIGFKTKACLKDFCL